MDQKYGVYFGRLGRHPELRRTQDGEYICDFSLAINQGKDHPPKWKKIVVWGEIAQQCRRQLRKGSEVFVRGRESVKSFTDKEGKTRSYMEIAAHLIGFIDIPK